MALSWEALASIAITMIMGVVAFVRVAYRPDMPKLDEAGDSLHHRHDRSFHV